MTYISFSHGITKLFFQQLSAARPRHRLIIYYAAAHIRQVRTNPHLCPRAWYSSHEHGIHMGMPVASTVWVQF
jgi:hypothetical protein